MGFLQRRPKFGFQARRDRVPTSRQGSDHHTSARTEIGRLVVDEVEGSMTQPTGYSVTLHRGTDRLGNHEAYLGSVVAAVREPVVQRMHDEIGLNRPYSVANRDTEISRPCHPIPGRKHCPEPCVESRSQRAAALAAAARHDGAACTRTHTQPETVHTGPAAVVRLKSPLALGHGCFSSFSLVSTPPNTMTVMAAEDTATVGKLIHLAGAAPLRFRRTTESQPYHHVRATVRGY